MIRVLPITILCLLAFVGFIGFKSFNDASQAVDKVASKNAAKEISKDADKGTDDIIAQLSKDLNQLETTAGSEEKPKEEKAAPDVSGTTEGKPSPKEAAASGAKGDEKPKEEAAKEPGEKDLPAYVKKERPAENIPTMTKSGKELLEQMAARRTELDEWKKDLDLRASLIEASSHTLDDKITKLEKLQVVTQKLLDSYKVEDNKKIKSMVKVYENMKPKDAATVFNQLDMPILLEIVEQMNERRLSAILAKMDSAKAKDLTETIIKNRELAKM